MVLSSGIELFSMPIHDNLQGKIEAKRSLLNWVKSVYCKKVTASTVLMEIC